MTDYRFKSYAETAAGEYYFMQDTITHLAGYPPVIRVVSGVVFGIAGTEFTGTFPGATIGGGALADLAGFEKKTERRTGRQKGHYYYVRVYEVPFNTAQTLPLPGDYFPGEVSGPRILDGGVTTSPVVVKGGEPTNLRVTIVAGGPLYADAHDSAGELFSYGI